MFQMNMNMNMNSSLTWALGASCICAIPTFQFRLHRIKIIHQFNNNDNNNLPMHCVVVTVNSKWLHNAHLQNIQFWSWHEMKLILDFCSIWFISGLLLFKWKRVKIGSIEWFIECKHCRCPMSVLSIHYTYICGMWR